MSSGTAVSPTAAAPPPLARRRGGRPNPRRKGRDPLARGVLPLIVPAMVVTMVIVVAPILYSVWLSVSEQSPSGVNAGFAGFVNFSRMFNDPLFFQSVRVTLFLFVVCLIVETLLGLGLGYLLSVDVPGKRIFQGAMLIPAITAPVAVGLLWLMFYDPTSGVANKVLHFFGVDPVVWLGNPALAPWAIAIVDIWQWTPLMALIISAGIRSLPTDPFEAAAMDGATGWRAARYIGLPLLAPVLTVAMLLRTVDLVRFFDTVYVMTQGGPINSTNTLNVYGYRTAFVNQDPNYAAVLQIALLLVVILIAGLFTFARKRYTIEY